MVKGFVVSLRKLFVPFLILTTLTVGCGRTPSPSSPISTPLATLSSVLPTPPIPAAHNKIILALYPAHMSGKAALYISDSDGSNLQSLVEISPDPGSILSSPNKRLVAFFTSGTESDGAVVVWDVKSRETIFNIPVATEVSTSFRDAPPARYLAWSPDSQNLAIVMNRDLYLANIVRREMQMLVRHREEQYNLAGLVMGTIGHPTWTTNGNGIVYDTFSPPDILSASADQYLDIEYVDISSKGRKILLSGARILQTFMSDKQELLVQSQDGRHLLLDLTTLELREYASPEKLECQYLCDAEGRSCALISMERGNCDSLYLKLPGSRTYKFLIEDIGKTRDCQFQSILWDGSDVLLVTVGCADQAELWSLGIPGLQFVQLGSWRGISTAILLLWLE
ncbi:MAG: hypothetical protein QXS68_07060 [Candidatus Methanomethylicaceae archaeon]